MADKTIKDLPLVSEVNGNIKIPASTGGTKAAAVSVGQMKEYISQNSYTTEDIIKSNIIGESFSLTSAVRDEDGDVISAEIVYSDGKAGSITLTRDEDGDVSKVDGVYDKQTFTYNIERDTDGNVTSTNFEFL